MKKALALFVSGLFTIGSLLPFGPIDKGTVAFASINKAEWKQDGRFLKEASLKKQIWRTYQNTKGKKNGYLKGQVIIGIRDGAVLDKSSLDAMGLVLVKKYTENMALATFDEKNISMDTILKQLNEKEEIAFAEPNYFKRNIATAQTEASKDQTDWWMKQVNVEAAWKYSKGSPDVIVGVLDTGVDYNHEALRENIYINKKEIPGDGIDNDHNGYVDDVHGYDFGDGDSDPMDTVEHGTHIAGIIGAKESDSGVTGLAPNIKILPLKFSDSRDAIMDLGAELEAITYGRKMGVEIFNCSFGSEDPDPAEFEMIRQNPDAIFICAAGNGDEQTKTPVNTDMVAQYPADFDLPNILSVAAVMEDGGLAYFSDYGKTTVDMGAPGYEIKSTMPGGRYGNMSGTSMAAPFVTGTVALMKSIDPYLSTRRIISILTETVDRHSELSDKVATGGSLNAGMAVSRALAEKTKINGIMIQPEKTSMYVGWSKTFQASLLPGEIQTKLIQWSSSDPSIATVDENGVVKAIKKGSVEIRGTEKTSGLSGIAKIEVKTFVPEILKVGKTLNMTFAPTTFINGEARLWLIRPDGTEATFDMITDSGKKVYKASIRSDNDGFLATSELNPFRYYGTWEIEMIEVVDQKKTIYNFYNEKYFDAADDKHIPMDFEKNRFLVEDGIHTIKDQSVDGSLTSLDKNLGDVISCTEFRKSTESIYIGSKLQLQVFAKARTGIYTAYVTYVKPDDATVTINLGINPQRGYYYANLIGGNKTEENEKQLNNVKDEGLWRAKEITLIDMARNKVFLRDDRFGDGKTSISLAGLDFNVKAQTLKAEEIRFSDSQITMKKGSVYKPILKFLPESITDQDVILNSSNGQVISVNKYGMLLAKKKGNATIQVTLKKDKNITAFLRVIVK